MTRRTLGWVALVSLLLLPVPALADPGPVLALHATSSTTSSRSICTSWAPQDLPCSDFVTHQEIGEYSLVYVLVGRMPDGISAVDFGLQYNINDGVGVDVFGGILCSGGLSFDDIWWPQAGTGITITWLDCQDSPLGNDPVRAIPMALEVYAYSSDTLSVSSRWHDDHSELWVSDCSGTHVPVPGDNRGAVGFSEGGNVLGYNPCSGEGTVPPDLPPPVKLQDPAAFLHIHPDSGPVGCLDAPATADDVVTEVPVPGSPTTYEVFLLASPVVYDRYTARVGLVRLGIASEHPEGSAGLEIVEWHGCGGAVGWPIRGWPASGSGITLTWGSGCPPGDIVVGGYFTVEVDGPAIMKIDGYPDLEADGGGLVSVVACGSLTQFEPIPQGRVGWVSLGGAALGNDTDGCNPLLEPCGDLPTAAKPSSWGKLKARY